MGSSVSREMTPGQLEEFDLMVLGTGEGAKFVAWTLVRQGNRVAVVERLWIGAHARTLLVFQQEHHP